MKLRTIFLACVLISMVGCIPSLYPLYDKDSITFDENLLGNWNFEDGNWWKFEKSEDRLGAYYKIQMYEEDDDDTSQIAAHLVRIDNAFFLDFEAEEEVPIKNTFLSMHFWPVHTFGKIEFLDDRQFALSFFNYEHLKDLIEKGRIRIKHEQPRTGEIILTASSSDLQKFIAKYRHEEKAFDESTLFTRWQQ